MHFIQSAPRIKIGIKPMKSKGRKILKVII